MSWQEACKREVCDPAPSFLQTVFEKLAGDNGDRRGVHRHPVELTARLAGLAAIYPGLSALWVAAFRGQVSPTACGRGEPLRPRASWALETDFVSSPRRGQ